MLRSNYIHHFIEGTDLSDQPIVLLRGSGGNEKSLLSFANEIAPTASKLAIRGSEVIDGGYAFFNRFPDRSVNEVDLRIQAIYLASFIRAAISHYSLSSMPIFIGYSNGSIMASALLLTETHLCSGAVLLRPFQPFKHDLPYKIDQKPALIIEGNADERRVTGDGLRTAEQLKRAGAHVEHHTLTKGHALTAQDSNIARRWLAQLN